MKTRKKIPKKTFRNLLLWKLPKYTRKHFQRKYDGNFYIDTLYTEPMREIYSRKPKPPRKRCCYPKRIHPFTLHKKQSYVWRISGGLFHRI